MVILLDLADEAEICSDLVICRCLQVTETAIADACARCPLQTVGDITRETGAGGGCTACHRVLRRYLKQVF